MVSFIGKALFGAPDDVDKLTKFDKFGMSLFMSGACEAYGAVKELKEDVIMLIMSDSIKTMGFKTAQATNFASKFEEYLVQDPSYMSMFQAGRNAMSTYLTQPEFIAANMKDAIVEWNQPKKKSTSGNTISVLFTDIAGSTAMTQELGDEGAQHVVRAHNRVVREALTMCNGIEVKHTGDGIMASFNKASDSLDAAIQMQREASAYTEQNPDAPLHLKIGINAGEPISEDNDLFGATIQMAARIVDKAQAGEIYISDVVRAICTGKTYTFTSRGTFPMKGFDEDPELFEVPWAE